MPEIPNSRQSTHRHRSTPAGGGVASHAAAEPDRSDGVWLLRAVRYVIPGGVVAVGVVFMAIGGSSDLEGGAGLVSAGLAIYFINWLFRVGAAGEREREAEDAARDYFDRHGRWPH